MVTYVQNKDCSAHMKMPLTYIGFGERNVSKGAKIKQQHYSCACVDALCTSQQRFKVSKGAKIRKRYSQVPHLTQDTNGKVTNSQLYTKNERQEVSPSPAGDHRAQTKRRAQKASSGLVNLSPGGL